MKILAIDTSTNLASIALISDTTTLAEQNFTCQRSLSSRLVQEVDHLLALADCDIHDITLFAVSIGPGSFTGVRCGVATVQGFALATGKPCAGFSALAALAMNFPHTTFPVCCLLDARKNEVYGALYNFSNGLPVPLIPETVVSVELFVEQACELTDAPLLLAGEGAVRYRESLTSLLGDRAHFSLPCHNPVRAAAGAFLAYSHYQQHGATELSALLPHYIRPSDAEIARLAKLNALT